MAARDSLYPHQPIYINGLLGLLKVISKQIRTLILTTSLFAGVLPTLTTMAAEQSGAVIAVPAPKKTPAATGNATALGQKLYAPQAWAKIRTAEHPGPVLAEHYSAATLASMAVVLSESWQHGLNPDTYRADVISAALKQPDARDNLELDTLMLDSLARYVGDMTGMRVRATTIGLRSKDWRVSLAPDVAINALLASPDPIKYLNDLLPKSALYSLLQKELLDLRASIEKGDGDKAIYPIRPISRTVHPGDVNAAIGDLRERLGVRSPESNNNNEYDDRLAQVVMQFQRNHGLKDDGIIGPQTIRFFNQTHNERYRQVIANLERMRWLNPEKPKKYIVINIPAATLWAVEDDTVKSEMPVIVGRVKRPTAQFQAMVSGVRFNPTWTVPEVIKKEDFLPELQKDPTFLTSKGIDVWKKDGDESVLVDPAYVDWASITEKDLAQFRMVQGSGKSNALGQIRVLMPNDYGIYLHDTNTPEYFRDDARTISSGCVRLSRPQEIARFVLDGVKDWSDEKMQKIIADEKTREIPANPPFPVILLYQTAWMKTDGTLVLAYDIYEEDLKLYDALVARKLVPPFSPPAVPLSLSVNDKAH